MSMERHCKNALEEENQRLREENDRLMDIVVSDEMHTEPPGERVYYGK